MAKIEGSCLCGQVQYASMAEPLVVALCNCTHCQKQSGGAFSVNVGIPKGSLKFETGQTQVFADRGSSGQAVYRHFCPNCGSPIFSDVVSRPGLIWLKAGTLKDTSWVKPTMSLWCESAQSWVHQPDIQQFRQGPASV
ncbi:glutathione-dependent formaldehyde-activating GFA [Leptothrix cholodnii SP-6]|uniref:Glutathione-dependent formaldehyde-activating GFA n=1 Tax=Leptothrix cholodnii (strain ATCC 51168 / LMG 8142 / SP-6) TaxID=395495 RepID=B1Y1S2_LEPCP|nr:GFA family protein [Leptothrix cholodnii]ACB33102.1 glutathione-dependent formaldehyde-activating GFA [Leptothrix cholodnii SP-6]